MKVAALVLGLLGSFAVAVVGLLWTEAYDRLGELEQMEQTAKGLSATVGGDTAELDQAMAVVRKKASAAYPMLGLGLLALVASAFVFKLPKASGAVMALAGIVPAVLYPLALLFSFLLLPAALFAFLARPKAKAVA